MLWLMNLKRSVGAKVVRSVVLYVNLLCWIDECIYVSVHRVLNASRYLKMLKFWEKCNETCVWWWRLINVIALDTVSLCMTKLTLEVKWVHVMTYWWWTNVKTKTLPKLRSENQLNVMNFKVDLNSLIKE